MTADLRDLGVTPEHQDAQEVLDVLADAVNAAMLALLDEETQEHRDVLRAAQVAFHAARLSVTAAVYDRWYGDVESIPEPRDDDDPLTGPGGPLSEVAS